MDEIYQSIREHDREIRLLELLPSQNRDSLLEGRLSHVSLDAKPPYQCVSYVWGQPEFTELIQLNGIPLYITLNLHQVLQHLRLASESRTLWVDALCINQKDDVEKGKQVALMKEIYQLSKVDLVWLPSQTKASGHADSIPWRLRGNSTVQILTRGLEIVRNIQSGKITKGEVEEREWRPWFKRPLAESAMKSQAGESHPQSRLEIEVEATEFIRHTFRDVPIWKRVWIMQELAYSPRILLLSGATELHWQIISSFLANSKYNQAVGTIVGGHESWEPSIVDYALEAANTIELQRRELLNNKQTSFMDTLVKFRHTHATDPRDKIYAVLSLVSEPHSINIDYRKSKKEVFTESAIALINTMSNLDVICQSYWESPATRPKSNLPSWVPDFTHGKQSEDLYYHFVFAQRSVFNAGGTLCRTPCKTLDGSILQVSGVRLGQITRLSTYKRRDHYKEGAQDWFQSLFKECILDPPSQKYVTGESHLQAFWRTLVMDCKAYPIQRLSPEEVNTDHQIFEKWVANLSSPMPYHDDDVHPAPPPLSEWLLERSMEAWTFGVTDGGFYVMVLRDGTKEGDLVVTLDGAETPVVLRSDHDYKESGKDVFHVVHVAYVHGFMDGETRAWVKSGRLTESEFLIS